MTDPLADFREAMNKIAALPPRPRCFMASHAVPYGRVYRQWNTRGELIVWVNRGEVEDLPRLAVKRDDPWTIAPHMLTAIPVVNA